MDIVTVVSTSKSTPHARGSTLLILPYAASEEVYPACAGIHLTQGTAGAVVGSLPRMRGDPPHIPHYLSMSPWSTPHARGSTLPNRFDFRKLKVYPACAGIHLK